MTSFEEFCRDMNVTIETGFRTLAIDSDGWKHYTMQCVLKRANGRKLMTPFKQGTGHKRAPSAAEVLECLISDARSACDQTFASWCADLGYDDDSRKAYATYEQCIETNGRLAQFLSPDYSAFIDALDKANQ